MPHLEHLPGSSETTSGCIEQVYIPSFAGCDDGAGRSADSANVLDGLDKGDRAAPGFAG